MNIFKQFIGRITRPKGLIRCETQGYWRRCHGIPSFNFDWEDHRPAMLMDYDHPYQYQEWKQNWYGKWEPQQSWRGMNESLAGWI